MSLHPALLVIIITLGGFIPLIIFVLHEKRKMRKIQTNSEEYLKLLLGAISDVRIEGGRIQEQYLDSMERALMKLPKHSIVKRALKSIRKYRKLGYEDPFKVKFRYTLPVLLNYFAVMALMEPKIGRITTKNIERFRTNLDLNDFLKRVISEIYITLQHLNDSKDIN